jgi:hypothetical protein
MRMGEGKVEHGRNAANAQHKRTTIRQELTNRNKVVGIRSIAWFSA